MPMHKIHWDALNLDISLLGFGCMRLPVNAQGTIDYPEAEKLIDTSYQSGINYFDTAYMYHDGESQDFLGKVLTKYPRDSYYLANKMPVWMCDTPSDVQRVFEDQLARCSTDYFDFYLVHALDAGKIRRMKKFKVMEFLREMQRQGKIHFLGFSFHGELEAFEELLAEYRWDFVQIQLNYFDWEYLDSKTLYQMLEEKNIPCVVMEPVRGGFLANLPESAASVLDPSRTPAEWALSWCAGLPNVKLILSGMSNLPQTQQNIELFSGNFSVDGKQTMFDDVRRMILENKAVPCTGCRYCMDCPHGVKIPEIFQIYNQYKLFGNKEDARDNYRYDLRDGQRADSCIGCGACEAVCPQHIEIAVRLAEIHATYAEWSI